MDNEIKYVQSEQRVLVGKKKITVRNLRPVFKDEDERERTSQQVQARLYKVFSKYVSKGAS